MPRSSRGWGLPGRWAEGTAPPETADLGPDGGHSWISGGADALALEPRRRAGRLAPGPEGRAAETRSDAVSGTVDDASPGPEGCASARSGSLGEEAGPAEELTVDGAADSDAAGADEGCGAGAAGKTVTGTVGTSGGAGGFGPVARGGIGTNSPGLQVCG